MTSDPFFSVIIPTYNRARFIDATVGSVLKQVYSNFEVIVVDDDSTDNTAEVVAGLSDGRIRYFRKSNGERGAARNFGFHHSKGDYVNFLDSDDLLYSHHLSAASEFIREHANPEVFHMGYDIRTSAGKMIRAVKEIHDVNEKLLLGNYLSCNGVFIRRDIMQFNLFNEDRDLASLEDWELWLRLAARFKIRHGSAITSTVIQHDERSVMTGNVEQIERKVEKLIRCITEDPVNKRTFARKLKRPVASAGSYAALHLSMAGAPKKKTFGHLRRAISLNPAELFRKRFLVVLKYLLFGPNG